MNAIKLALGILAVLGLSLLAAPVPPAFDWTGTWVGSVDTGIGMDTLTLVLKKADKTYEGTVNDSMSLIEKDTVLTDVKIVGDEISFSFKSMGGSMEFAMKMSAKGEDILAEMMNKAVGEWGPVEISKKK